MTWQYPGQYNVSLLNWAANKLKVDFSRNVDSFKVNKYSQIVPVTQSIGPYLYVDPIVAAKVESDLRDVVWPENQTRPQANYTTEDFQWRTYRTTRKSYTISIGQLTVENANAIGWDLIAQNSRHAAMRAMTARTIAAKNALDSATLPSGHVIDVHGTYGATWANATASGGQIRKSIIAGVNQILKATLGVVKPEDLVLVIGPEVAAAMRNSEEIVDLIKQSPTAASMLQHTEMFDQLAGLPSRLYGVTVVIDETMRVTSALRQREKTVTPVWDTTRAYLLARPGALIGTDGAVNYSSVVLFMREEMNVEAVYDQFNRLNHLSITEDWDCQVVAPVSVVRFTNIVTAPTTTTTSA